MRLLVTSQSLHLPRRKHTLRPHTHGLHPQAKALRSFEAAFRDSQHGWSSGVAPEGEGRRG